MRYVSTRGGGGERSFEQVLLAGLAPDGGLYVPAAPPAFSPGEIAGWRGLPYAELALEVIAPFVGGDVPAPVLRRIVEDSYRDFDHPEVAPLSKLGENEWLLELHHGPTLAFKDFALQLLGRLLGHTLERRGRRAVVLGATSGDTGSAAIEGCRHSDRVDVFILHPFGRVSEAQRRQMTAAPGDNVHNFAVKGSFDDCQRIVKAAFADRSFLPEGRELVAVNSINWARIMAQTVYYFRAALALGGPERPVSFSVPTGNFGDMFAGHLARRMGLPVGQLIVATNSNDVLHRLIERNERAAAPLRRTLSPSMDIQAPSNLERYLFELFEGDGAGLASFMERSGGGRPALSERRWRRMRADFDSAAVDDETVRRTMVREMEAGRRLDPHTAVGLAAARRRRRDGAAPMVALATAHPAKFAEAAERAGLPPPPPPARLAERLRGEERCEAVEADPARVAELVRRRLRR